MARNKSKRSRAQKSGFKKANIPLNKGYVKEHVMAAVFTSTGKVQAYIRIE